MRIGFIGLGTMGRPMVEHLLAAGHDLCVWSRRPASAEFAVQAGATRCETPTELARECEVICTNVYSDPDVEALAFGDDGIARGLAPGGIHVDFSTISPSLARALARRYVAQGADFVDAPVSGGGGGVKNRTLTLMWGGRAELETRLRPIFACFARTIVRIGAAGDGQVAKACNQMVMVSAIAACAEAAHLADAAGVDFDKVRQALLGGSAASRVLDLFGGKMLARDFAAGVEARLHHKDFVTTLAEATTQAIPLPVAGAVLQQLDALMAAGWGMDDTSRLLCVLERAAGTDFNERSTS